jgi:hypothetical protein
MKNENEIWKGVDGFEGVYYISSAGRLASRKKRDKKGLSLHIHELNNKKGDYFRVVLRDGDKRKSISVHRLVANTFIRNTCGYPVVNHIDGNKQNNRVENLEWCTRSQNVKHAIQMHPKQLSALLKYNKEIKPKRIIQFDVAGNRIADYASGVIAGQKTGICQRNILQCCNHENNGAGYLRKSAGGYIWRFEEEVMRDGGLRDNPFREPRQLRYIRKRHRNRHWSAI